VTSGSPTTIGPYTITRELGRGGMGVVYLATDTRLDRQVAIKALPVELASDPARLERFEREARTLASLSHANLAGIHGVEEQDGARYLVLEFVEGETLADMLDRGPLPVDDAIELAVQIAAGVEAAHEAGVIHRDLKPANIIITPDGKAKVLDFGLARTDEGGQSSTGGLDSPTMTTPRPQHSPTIAGAILGTAAYMSPEQARGRRVDKRTDIWSFGVVLYEMLVGASPFHGETASDSIGAVLHKGFDLDQLPPGTPANVRRVLERCLVRDRNLRYRDIGDVRIELEREGDHSHLQTHENGASARPWKIAAGVSLLVAISAWGWLVARPEIRNTPQIPTLELVIPLPAGYEIKGSIAISRDGQRVAFCAEDDMGDRRLYIRELDRFDLTEVPYSRDAEHPTFSSDGRSVLFFKQDGLFRASVEGGPPVSVAKTTANVGISAGDDGSVIYSTGVDSPLWRIPPGGGPPVAITNLSDIPGTYAHVWPQHIPGTDKVLLTQWSANIGGGRITDTETGVVLPILDDPNIGFEPPARWVASGHLILEAWGTLIAVPFDPERGADFDGYERNQVLTSVYHLENATRCVFDVSDNGTLAYVPGNPGNRSLVWVEQDGTAEGVIGTESQRGFRLGGNISISPDGTQALVGGGGDIAVIDLARGVPRRITFDEGNNLYATWSDDATRVVFNSNRQDNWAVWSVAPDGLNPPELIYKDDTGVFATSTGPNGLIAFDLTTTDAGDDLWIIDADGNARPLVSTRYDESNGAISTDGQWVAFTSNISGRDEIYVIPISGAGQPVQISVGGGDSPKWGPMGTSLYYRVGRSIMRIEMDQGRPAGERSRAFEGPVLVDRASYALSPDETRLLAIEVADDAIPDEIRIITNFFDTLRNVAGPGSRQEPSP
jgi:Tol biopolymer transport system component/predicted Ser/Thr protein kinase